VALLEREQGGATGVQGGAVGARGNASKATRRERRVAQTRRHG